MNENFPEKLVFACPRAGVELAAIGRIPADEAAVGARADIRSAHEGIVGH
jgi:hypothetical protein